MLFEKIKSDILAHNSYIVGADGEAAVIDPRRDCLVYAAVAGREGMKITKIFETHRNEDYVTGSRDLARPTGAEILHGAREEFGFGTAVREGGDVLVRSARTRDPGDARPYRREHIAPAPRSIGLRRSPPDGLYRRRALRRGCGEDRSRGRG